MTSQHKRRSCETNKGQHKELGGITGRDTTQNRTCENSAEKQKERNADENVGKG